MSDDPKTEDRAKPDETAVESAALAADTALMAAWRRFLDYDTISTEQKRNFIQIRSWVIVLILFTSTFAVFTTFLPEGHFLRELLRLALIIMPVAAVAVINYASQYASTGAWVEYRVSAEIIRSQIYLYRARAGDYKDKDTFERQQLLLKAIDEANDRITQQNAALPYLQPTDDQTLTAQILERTKPDDGVSPLTIDQYIAWRAKPQMNWYIDKIRDDYVRAKRVSWLALVIGGLGSVISAVVPDYVGLVAITTAAGVALAQYSSVRMYGATYGIFHQAASDLQNMLNQWEILPKSQTTPEDEANTILALENILQREREAWRYQALETQTNTEQAIYQNLSVKGAVPSTTIHPNGEIKADNANGQDSVG